jgi:hypothetical protein
VLLYASIHYSDSENVFRKAHTISFKKREKKKEKQEDEKKGKVKIVRNQLLLT